MLYNKDWDKPKVETDPYSIDDLIAWLEKYPANKVYNYGRSNLCLMAQWAAQFGAVRVPDHNTYGYTSSTQYINLGLFHDVSVTQPHNFGAALKRAKHMRGDRWWKFW